MTNPTPDLSGIEDMPHQVAAFMRKLEKSVKANSPEFALVVMGENGEPYVLLKANRTGLVVAATTLLFETLEQDKQGLCICPTCDDWTARARLALRAMGHTLPAAN